MRHTNTQWCQSALCCIPSERLTKLLTHTVRMLAQISTMKCFWINSTGGRELLKPLEKECCKKVAYQITIYDIAAEAPSCCVLCMVMLNTFYFFIRCFWIQHIFWDLRCHFGWKKWTRKWNTSTLRWNLFIAFVVILTKYHYHNYAELCIIWVFLHNYYRVNTEAPTARLEVEMLGFLTGILVTMVQLPGFILNCSSFASK